MQTHISDQPAFILHRRDYQESSLILELLTADYGRITVLAKGARKRRDAASFQSFNRLAVGWSGRSEMKTLTQIESQSLLIPAQCYLPVFYINELLLFLLAKHDEQRVIFQRYQLLLLGFSQLELTQGIDISSGIEPLLRNYEIDLLTELGLMPELTVLGYNQQEVDATGKYIYVPESGIQLAENDSRVCFMGGDLIAINQRQWDTTEVLKSGKRLLRQIIDFNLNGRQLQSRQLYKQMNSSR
jgi:DNA repair protein RecO (recombination protein O)